MEYSLGNIARLTGGKLSGADVTVEAVFVDSRTSQWGGRSMFVAIRGANHNGHLYIGELYERGIRAFIVEEDIDTDIFPDAGFVRVENSVEALQALAADYRRSFEGIVVGITGSNGKTMVKEWIAQLAPEGIKVFRSPRSYNSQVGVPLSVLMIEGDEQIAVIEAGISLPGEMERLERIIRPDIGLFTTLGDAHQQGFESLAHKLDEKLKLFVSADTIIYNPVYGYVDAAIKKLYGDRRLIAVDGSGGGADRIVIENRALAVTFYDALGYDHDQTVARAQNLQPVAMRLELKDGVMGSIIVDDSYNADINSLAIALNYLGGVAGQRGRVLFISDILQSGLDDRTLYERVAVMAESAGIEHIIGIGEKIRKSGVTFRCRADFFASVGDALNALTLEDIAGKAILIKGNRASQFERLSHALQLKTHTTTLEIDLDAMRHNLNQYRALLGPGTRLMAMVKASGYGNGDYEVANMLEREGVDFLAVAFADEGMLLRSRGITAPIVVLNADEDSFDVMIEHRLEPEIYSFRSLEAFAGILRRYSERSYPVHIKLDTGMHRLGFMEGDVERLCDALAANADVITVRSVFSHLSAADEIRHDDFTRNQIALFARASSTIAERLGYPVIRHLANSAGIERFPDARFDMCRLGIGLYGVGISESVALKSVSTLCSRVVQVKTIAAGESVGYGRSRTMERESQIAVIPVGYADGLDRRLGNGRWSIAINGKRAPLVGRVCMDTCMADVTGLDISEGDRVVIFGPGEGNTVDDMARVLGTIPYEVMTGISARVKRIYIKE